jgi:hypothetical protein
MPRYFNHLALFVNESTYAQLLLVNKEINNYCLNGAKQPSCLVNNKFYS